MADKNSLRYVPLNLVRPSPAALRSVETDRDEFREFVDSIRSKGILNPVVVREAKDNDSGQTYYALVDGLHRWTGAKEAGLETIPVHIITADDLQALESQIVTNIQKIETKPAQYADGLKRLLMYNNTLTVPELSKKLGKSSTWLEQRLKLTKLSESVKELVDDGKINASNAQALADLPGEEINDYLDRAMTMPPQQFIPLARGRAKEYRDAQRQGRSPAPKTFSPTPFLQGLAATRDELLNLSTGKSLINQFGAETALDGWKLALEWSINMDPISIKKQEEKYNLQKEENKRKREERKKEKEETERQKAAAVVATQES